MNIFDLQATISLNGDAFMSGVQQASGEFNNLGNTIKGTALGKLTADAVKAAGTAVVGFGKDVVQTGMDFESGMSQVAATLGMTMDDISNNVDGAGDKFDALKATAAEMGRETIFSATEAAEGLNILAMSGFDANMSIEMLPDVLNLAAAGGMSLGNAAAYISGTMKGFSDETKTSQYYADIMAKGATLASTSVSQLGDAMSSGAAGAAAFGQSTEAMGVALLRLAEQNEVGSAAGTAYAALLQEVFTPKTVDAAKALESLGVSTYDEYGKARDLNDIVNDLSEAMSGMDEATRNNTKSTLFGRQALDAFNKMTVTGVDKQNEWRDALGLASDGAGEAAKQYKTMTDNLEGAKAGLDSAFDGLENAVYEKLSDPLKEAANTAADALNRITQGFEEGGIKGALSELGSFIKETLSNLWDNLELPPTVVAIGDTLKATFDKAKSAVESTGIGKKIADAVDTIAWSFDNAKKLSGGFAEAFGENGIPGVLSKFGSFVLDFWSGIKENMLPPDIYDVVVDFEIKIEDAFNRIKDAFGNVDLSGIKEKLSGAFNGIRETLGGIDFGGIFESAKEKLANAFETIKSAISEKIEAIRPAFDSLKGVFENLGDAFSGFDTGFISTIVGSIQSLIGTFQQFGQIKMDAIVGAVQGFADAFVSLDIGDSIANIVQQIGDLFGAFAGASADVISGVAGAVAGFLDGFSEAEGFEAIGQIAKDAADLFGAFIGASADVISAIGGGISSFLSAFDGAAVGGIIADIAKSAADLFGAFKNIASTVVNEIAGAISTFLGTFDYSGAAEIIQSIASVVADLFGAFSGTVAAVINSVADAFSGFGSKVAELWNTMGPNLSLIGDALSSFAEYVGDTLSAVQPIIEAVVSYFADVFVVGIQIAIDQVIVVFGGLVNSVSAIFGAIMEFGNAMVSLFKGDLTGAVEHFKHMWEDIKQFFSGLKDILIEPFKSFARVLGDEANKGVQALKKPFESVATWFVNIGKNIVEGLKNGISGAWSGFTGWLSEKCSGLISGVMGLFGENSPSKVFADIGENLVLGMEVGWNRSFDATEKRILSDLDGMTTEAAEIGFERSAIGKSSAAGISAMNIFGADNRVSSTINLNVDGEKVASVVYDPLNDMAVQMDRYLPTLDPRRIAAHA